MVNRNTYLDLAAQGLRMPIGTHLTLSAQRDPQACQADPQRLGEVMLETARRYQTPLVFPLMDLMVEKREVLSLLELSVSNVDTFHFGEAPDDGARQRLLHNLSAPVNPQLQVYAGAIRRVAAQPGVIPLGMAIGPFSLATKLLADPITPVYLAGTGLTAEEEPEIQLFETCLELGLQVILRSIRLQLEAGARAVCLCEPAANKVYISPQQLQDGADTLERYVLAPNRRIRALLAEYEADLIFHDCGELTDEMVAAYATLDPAIMSLGSSVELWRAARHVPATTVLFGNLASKQFYSDAVMPEARVAEDARQLVLRMQETGHPFILGTECDVLHVPGCEESISRKVMKMMTVPI